MILAIDVQYVGDQGFISAVSFDDWDAMQPSNEYNTVLGEIADYEPGSFYKRELPCIVALLDEYSLSPDIIVVDGYVTLNEQETPGLGLHLYNAIGGRSQVIGVAKRSFLGVSDNTKIYRGTSNNPLFVTSVGIDLEEAKCNILTMHGKNRIPILLKRVDRMCRDKASDATQALNLTTANADNNK